MIEVLYDAMLVVAGLWALALAWMLLRVELAYRDLRRRHARLEAQQQRLLSERLGTPPPEPPPHERRAVKAVYDAAADQSRFPESTLEGPGGRSRRRS
jgi:hypothetical protein